MRSARGRRPAGGDGPYAGRLLAASALALAFAVTGCAGDGQPMAGFASGRGATIAFESIDGPPQPVFQKLVEDLAAEAVARQVMVISREATPSYRVRGYMAARMEGRRTHIGWVWDVYDANKHRVLRIASEEPGSRRGGDAWAAADDAMLRRIARASMDRLAAFIDAPGAPRSPSEPPAGADGANIAAIGSGARADASSFAPAPPANASALEAALALADRRP